jgi:DNA-binding transcriptional regulator YiaG
MPGKKHRSQWNKQQIQALRRHLRLTQSEMADKLGTRQQTISEWEVGLYEPRGASGTLLNIVAERTGFKYEVRQQRSRRLPKG